MEHYCEKSIWSIGQTSFGICGCIFQVKMCSNNIGHTGYATGYDDYYDYYSHIIPPTEYVPNHDPCNME